MRATILAALLWLAAASPLAAQSCAATAGMPRAQELARQCREVSPATHPPCNPDNPCALIAAEIRRGCAILTERVPGFCRDYQG